MYWEIFYHYKIFYHFFFAICLIHVFLSFYKMNAILEYLVEFRAEFEEKILFKLFGNNGRIAILRRWGVKIGDGCLIYSRFFDSEPYLIKIGNHVAVASGVRFITHDGGVWVYRNKNPEIDCFGRIIIGDNCFIGLDSIILPNSIIGNNCIIGAGSVVRGTIPDNSVVMGNPAKVVMKGSFLENMYSYNKNTLQLKKYSNRQKKKILIKHFNLSIV